MKPQNQDTSGREPSVPGLPELWTRVEEFTHDYWRGLARVGLWNGPAERLAVRMGVMELEGPIVVLEIHGTERRVGVVARGSVVLAPVTPRQRYLAVGMQKGNLYGFAPKPGDASREHALFAIDLPPGTRERQRLERVVLEGADEALHPPPSGGAWEDAATRMRLALGVLVWLHRAGRVMLRSWQQPPPRGEQLFAQAMESMRLACTGPLKLADLSRRIGVSPRHCARLLETWSGAGFQDHLQLLRLLHARQRLVTDTGSIEDTGKSVGFASRDHFIRAFRQTFGWTPLQFRKNWRRALEGQGEWAPLLEMPGRSPVEWLGPGSTQRSAREAPGKFHTLCVGNATRDTRVLQKVAEDGAVRPMGMLLPGQILYFDQDGEGSFWRCLDAQGVWTSSFRTGDRHALALLTR